MDGGHAQLLGLLRRMAPAGLQAPTVVDAGDSYTSGGHAFYRVGVPERRRMLRQWLASQPGMGAESIVATCNSLIRGASFEEKTLAGMLLKLRGDARLQVGPGELDAWLVFLSGWAEVDSMCQNVFGARQMLDDWRGWSGLIHGLSVETNINKRRASLVLLTGPVHYSQEPRLSSLAFEAVDRLRGERDQLITKAVSWLLRCLVTNHREDVAQYLDANGADLPKIAVRETRVKLATGTKRGRV